MYKRGFDVTSYIFFYFTHGAHAFGSWASGFVLASHSGLLLHTTAIIGKGFEVTCETRWMGAFAEWS